MPISNPPIVPALADGDIAPSRFVSLVLGKNNKIKQCGPNERPCGVSQEAPYGNQIYGSTTLAADLDHPQLNYYGPGFVNVLLELAESVSANARLAPAADGSGRARNLPGSIGPHYVGAIAQQSGNAGDKISVWVQMYSETFTSSQGSSASP